MDLHSLDSEPRPVHPAGRAWRTWTCLAAVGLGALSLLAGLTLLARPPMWGNPPSELRPAALVGLIVGGAALGLVAVAALRSRGGHQAERAVVVGALGLSIVSFALEAFANFLWGTTRFVIEGRPLWRRGRAITAPVESGTAWQAQLRPSVHHLTESDRAGLATAWLTAARYEHASVAAFSHLSLKLQVVGAPPALLAWTHRAASEEVHHAELCFALASAYAGRDYTAAPWPTLPDVRGSWPRSDRRDQLVRLATESLVDGALGEGWAAAIALAAAQKVTDPVVRKVLEQIAREEAQHAELGWAMVAWCAQSGGRSVVCALYQALGEVDAIRARPAQSPHNRVDLLSTVGNMSAADQEGLRSATHAQVRQRLEHLTELSTAA
ncbi:MAG: hypothetical protein HW416_837 [Chloroflexi bacterium]|nr:hypothetical protein [Chloroflexota bacterium]